MLWVSHTTESSPSPLIMAHFTSALNTTGWNKSILTLLLSILEIKKGKDGALFLNAFLFQKLVPSLPTWKPIQISSPDIFVFLQLMESFNDSDLCTVIYNPFWLFRSLSHISVNLIFFFCTVNATTLFLTPSFLSKSFKSFTFCST